MVSRAICRLTAYRPITRAIYCSNSCNSSPFRANFSTRKGHIKTDLSEKFYKKITKISERYDNPIWSQCVRFGGIVVGTAFVCGGVMCLVVILYTGYHTITRVFDHSKTTTSNVPAEAAKIAQRTEPQQTDGVVSILELYINNLSEWLKSMFPSALIEPKPDLEQNIEKYINSVMQVLYQDSIKLINDALAEVGEKYRIDPHLESRLRQLLQQCESRAEQLKTSTDKLSKSSREEMLMLESNLNKSLQSSKEEIARMESRLEKVKSKFCDEMDALLENRLEKFSHDIRNQQSSIMKENDINLAKNLKVAEERAALMIKSLHNEMQMLETRAQNLKANLTPVVREVGRSIQNEFKEKSSDLEIELAGLIGTAEKKSEKLSDYLDEMFKSAEKHLKMLEADFVKALENAKQRAIDSSIALPLEEATQVAEHKVLEATIAKLNQRQAIEQHKQMGGKKNDEFKDIERMANYVVERKIEAAYDAVKQLKKAIEQESSEGEHSGSHSLTQATEKMEKMKVQIDGLHSKKNRN